MRRANIPLKSFELKSTHLKNLLEVQSNLLVQNLDETTKVFLSETLISAKSKGWSYTKIIDEIESILPDKYASRADTIAYTEMSNMINEGERITAEKNGATKKMWTTVGGDVVDDDCLSNEDEGSIRVEESFPTGAYRPPEHPNCRCLIEYDIDNNLGFYWNGG